MGPFVLKANANVHKIESFAREDVWMFSPMESIVEIAVSSAKGANVVPVVHVATSVQRQLPPFVMEVVSTQGTTIYTAVLAETNVASTKNA